MPPKIGIALLLVICLCAFGCKEKVQKIIAENISHVQVTRYAYTYENDLLSSEVRAWSYYIGGIILYRQINTKSHFYDTKNRLIKEVEKTSWDSLPPDKPAEESTFEETLFRYDERDSVIEVLHLEANGDTAYWSVYEQFPDGLKVVKGRRINFDNMSREYNPEAMPELSYVYFTCQRGYNDGYCVVEKMFEDNKQIKRTKFEYDEKYGNRPVKKVIELVRVNARNPFTDSAMIDTETWYYNYARAGTVIECAVLDYQQDTIRVVVKDYNRKGELKRRLDDNRAAGLVTKQLFENGVLQKEIVADMSNPKFGLRITDYSYYPDGKIKSETVRRERIKKQMFLDGNYPPHER